MAKRAVNKKKIAITIDLALLHALHVSVEQHEHPSVSNAIESAVREKFRRTV